MYNRSTAFAVTAYFGVLLTAFAALALGLMPVLNAAADIKPSGTPEANSLELQLQTSREIRQALATPVVIPPLPPITARMARNAPTAGDQRELWRTARNGMNAMAMDLRVSPDANVVAHNETTARPQMMAQSNFFYPPIDRTAPQ